MSEISVLKDIITSQNRGIAKGICSICSANKYVLQAAIELEGKDGLTLIESTCNQVNQFGGYTGKTPIEFKKFVHKLALESGFSTNNIILGGDHLGPIPWRQENYDLAFKNAKKMISQYIKAGYKKIHLDASIPLKDDLEKKLPPKIIADRTAELCKIAEKTYHKSFRHNKKDIKPIYIIGTEVPYPGGSNNNSEEKISKAYDLKNTINLTKKAFKEQGLKEAWDNVIGIVVNPGIGFNKDSIKKYDRNMFKELKNELKNYNHLIFEGHSTDFQLSKSLKEMVEDKIAILKVGPALTFAAREAIFSLTMIEKELLKYNNNFVLSNFIDILEMKMIDNNKYCKEYYRGKEKDIRIYRKFSYFDCSRYYLSHPETAKALNKLISNLKSINIPYPLLSQYLPNQYKKVKGGVINNTPEALIKGKIKDVLKEYKNATKP